MKIIWRDGYNRETIADRLVCDNIKSKAEAVIMLTALRDNINESQWYDIVEDDYILSRGMEDLV